MLDLLSSYEHEFDVIVLSEVWCTNINYFNNIFPAYNFLFSVPTFQKAGEIGVLILKSLLYTIVDCNTDSNFNNLAEYLTLDVIYNRAKFRFYLFYRHPSSSISDFVNLLVS